MLQLTPGEYPYQLIEKREEWVVRVIVPSLLPKGCFWAEYLPQLPEQALCKHDIHQKDVISAAKTCMVRSNTASCASV